jgi:acyl-CoA reductase-like NAD-dependent aldehyde dehydrogenase
MSRTITTVNPATGEALRTYDAAGIDDILAILGAVHTAQPKQAARSSVCNAGCARRVRRKGAWWITGHSNHTRWHAPRRSVTLRR